MKLAKGFLKSVSISCTNLLLTLCLSVSNEFNTPIFPIFPSEGLKYSDQDLVHKFHSQGGGGRIS